MQWRAPRGGTSAEAAPHAMYAVGTTITMAVLTLAPDGTQSHGLKH